MPRLNLQPSLLRSVEVIPFNPAPESHLLDLNRSHETPAEEFRTLRTRLNHLQTLQPLHTVVTTSPSPADATFYLRIGVDDLIPRVVFSSGFDYWESGMDLYPSDDMYESFRRYQTALLAQFDAMAQEYDFTVIDASPDIRAVFERLRAGISRVLKGEPREPLFAVPAPEAVGEDSEGTEAAGAAKGKRTVAEK